MGYRAASSTLALKAGTYDLYIAQARAKTTLFGPVPLTLVNGRVQTLAVVDAALGGPLQLLPDGWLDRSRLGDIIFASPELRARLNGIVHPLVGARMRELEESAGPARSWCTTCR